MLIVLEGIDGGGKTTLAENLVKQAEERGWEAEVWHRGVPVRHPLDEYEHDLEQDYPHDAVDRQRRLVVADRWHLGQIVYGPLYRKDMKDFDLGCAWHVDRLLQSLGAVQLILQPPLEVALERAFGRGEDYLQRGHFEYVHKAYRSMVVHADHGATWDVGHGLFDDSIKLMVDPLDDHDAAVLLDVVECRSDRVAPLIPFKTYVGPRYPKILLLGDRHNHSELTSKDMPQHRAAFVPYGGTSGRWLCQAIVENWRRGARDVGLANANQEDLRALWEVLHYPKIVALGSEAHRAVADARIPHGTVPHPQYARRFHHAGAAAYVSAIITAEGTRQKVSPQW